jgi:hypothetical protein
MAYKVVTSLLLFYTYLIYLFNNGTTTLLGKSIGGKESLDLMSFQPVDQNDCGIDLYFLIHITAGFSYYYFYWALGICKKNMLAVMMVTSLTFELIENSPIGVNIMKLEDDQYIGDSWINMIFDVLATWIGYHIARRTTQSHKSLATLNIVATLLGFIFINLKLAPMIWHRYVYELEWNDHSFFTPRQEVLV